MPRRTAKAPRSDDAAAAKAAARRLAARQAGRHPAPANEGRSRNMQAIRRSGTKPEVALRSALHRAGLRYRVDHLLRFDDGRARPDLAFTRLRIAVFVDGCYWHACPEHGRTPSTNDWYWAPKLARNVERDRSTDSLLARHGWTVIRIWEHEALDSALAHVQKAVMDKRHTGEDARTHRQR